MESSNITNPNKADLNTTNPNKADSNTNFKVLMALMGLEIGGAETHVLELCKALKRRGVQVFAVSNGGAYVKELEEQGIVHFQVPLHNKRPQNLLTAYWQLKKIIVQNDIKLVHAHARIPAFLCGMLRKKLDFRLVTTAHWIFTTRFPFNVLTNWGERSLAVSDDIKLYLMDNYRIPIEHIRVTINGIDMNKFAADVDCEPIAKEFGVQKDEPCIVYVSRMDKDRSLSAHQLIEAAEALYAVEQNIKIIIVGHGNDFESIQAEAEQMNRKIGKNVIALPGARVDINRFTALGDIFVGVSRAALEAMSAGTPVVIAGNEGYIGTFTQEKLAVGMNTNFCCRGCQQSTTQELTKDLIHLLQMGAENRKKLGAYGQNIVREHYSVERMADDALVLYEWVRQSNRLIDVMISGYYGFGNNGDDAVLKSIIDDLKSAKPDINIMVLSKKPQETQRSFDVLSINRFDFYQIQKWIKQTNTLISGGGSLIQDLTSTHSLVYYLWVIHSAISQKAKVMLYANGIGPVRHDRNRGIIKRIVDKVDVITLRDENSFVVLNELGITKPRIQVTADATFSLQNTDVKIAEKRLASLQIARDEKYFCVAVRSWKYSKAGFENEIADFADYMAEKQHMKAVFIAMQPMTDTDISNRIIGLMKNPGAFLGTDYTTNEILGIIEKAEFVLGMRLHTVIYAMKAGKPIIGLVYDPKVKAVMDSIHQPYYVDVENVDSEKLKQFSEQILRNGKQISEEIIHYTADSRLNAAKNIEFAMGLLNQKQF